MQQRAVLWFLFAVVLIDMIGFGIVMPVLPQLIMHLGDMPVDSAAVWAGWLAAGYAAMQFVFAPIIGSLSDRFGRRPVLLACLAGFGIDYLVQGLAPSLGWLIVGRVVAGLTGASYSAAYAYIADVTPPEKRAASFGLMGMAFGFGFIIGPALGGLLGEIGPRVPFLAAAGLALINLLFGFFVLKESLPAEKRRPFSLARANALSALRALGGQSRAVIWTIGAIGVWQLAHIVYPSIWAYFAIEAYGWGAWQIGLSLAAVGVGSALVQGVLLGRVVARIGEVGAVLVGLTAVLLATAVFAIARSEIVVFAAILLNGLQGLIYPSLNALNSRALDAPSTGAAGAGKESSQGELQGATQAVGSVAQIIGPPMYAFVFATFSGPSAITHFPAMPLVLSAAIAVLAVSLFLVGIRRVPR
jgi:DHA1 family tetracycline resistance protein-like MFS transporter